MKHKRHIDFEDVLMDRRAEGEFVEIPLRDGLFSAVFLIAAVVFGALFVELFTTNVVDGGRYRARALGNISDEQVEEAPRGAIIDRFGEVLVANEPGFKAVLSPRDFPEDARSRLSLLARVGDVLGIPEEELARKIGERDLGQSDRLLLKEDLSHDEILALSSEPLPGISVEPSFRRVPVDPRALSHLVGYTGLVAEVDLEEDISLSIDDRIGRGGLEMSYDTELRGKNGKFGFFRDAAGKTQEKKSVQKSEQGLTLETNVDRGLQEYAYARLMQGLSELGRDTGALIAIDPRNGEVLALVSAPSYDPSDIENALSDPRKPLFNRAVQGVYNPGSTIKPLVATAALSEGVVTPSTRIYSAGSIEIPNPYDPENPSRFLDWKAHGWVDIHSALARSSNVYFYEVAGGFQGQKGIGIEKLKNWWEKFLLGEKTGIDLPGEESGFLPDPEWKERAKDDPWRVGDTYNVAIGQGDFSVTPIGLLNYISAIANGGKFFSPRVALALKDTEGNRIRAFSPRLLGDIGAEVSGALTEVRRGMRDAVTKEYGTAYLLHDLPVPVAAKTGTAQVQNNQRTNSFFVGYAPYDNPEIAVLVHVENSREGALNTVPIAKDIFLWYYRNRLTNR